MDTTQTQQTKAMVVRLSQPRWLLVGAILLAWALQLYHLDARPLYGDEWTSLRVVEGGPFSWNGLLYFILLRVWLAFGSGDFWLRALSVFPAVLAIPVIFLYARTISDDRSAAFTSLFVSTSPFVIVFAQQVRFYSLFLLTSALALWSFARWWKQPSLLNGLVLLFCDIVLLMSHLFSVFILSIQAIALLGKLRRRWLLPSLLSGLTLLALISMHPFLRRVAMEWGERLLGNPGDYAAASGLSLAQIAKIPLTFFELVLGEHVYPLNLGIVLPALFLLAFLSFNGLYGLGVNSAASADRVVFRLNYIVLPALALAIAYLLLDSLASVGGTRMSPRHLIFLVPIFWHVVAYGAMKLRGYLPLVAAAGVLLLLSCALRSYYYPDWSSAGDLTDWKGAATLVQRYVSPQTIMLYDGRSGAPTARYFPQELSRSPLWTYVNGDISNLLTYECIIVTTYDSKQGNRVQLNRPLAALHSHYQQVDGFVQYPFFIYVYERAPQEGVYVVDSVTGMLDIPEALYGLEFQDLRLPLPVRLQDGKGAYIWDAFQVPTLAGKRSLALPLGTEGAFSSVTLLSNVTAASGLAPWGTEIGTLSVYDLENRMYVYHLRLGLETAAWDGNCEEPCQAVHTWTKRMALVGSQRYEGAWRHFQAHIFAFAFHLPHPVHVARIEIAYTASKGTLNVWGLQLEE